LALAGCSAGHAASENHDVVVGSGAADANVVDGSGGVGGGGGVAVSNAGYAGTYRGGSGDGIYPCPDAGPVFPGENLDGGIRVEDTLATIGGLHIGKLHWSVDPEVTVSVGVGETDITVDIIPNSADVQYTRGDYSRGCSNHLIIGSQVRVTTADGDLSEDLRGPWVQEYGRTGISRPEFLVSLAPADVKGTLKVVSKSAFGLGNFLLSITCDAPCATCTSTCTGSLSTYFQPADAGCGEGSPGAPCSVIVHEGSPLVVGQWSTIRPGTTDGGSSLPDIDAKLDVDVDDSMNPDSSVPGDAPGQ